MPKKLPKSLKPEEFKELINHTIKVTARKKQEDKRMKVAFLLAYGAGMRISEVVSLKKENITKDRIDIWNAKGGKDRVVPLPKGWREWMLQFIPIGLDVRSLQRKFRIYADRAGLSPAYTFHSLRHGFATRLVEGGVPINHIQTLMGHSDISTTGIYLKARPEDALKSYGELF